MKKFMITKKPIKWNTEHVGNRSSVVYKSEKLATEYYNYVYFKLHCKSDTHKKTNI